MNTGPNRNLLWLVSGIVILIAIVAVILLRFIPNKHAPFYTQTVLDNCTGQTYTTTPNQGAERFQSSNPDVLIGGAAILNAGATQAQYQTFQQALAQYLKQNLKNRYSGLTIAPKTLSAVPGSARITAKLCLGLSDNRVNMAISLTQLSYVRVEISDPSGHNGGNYDSGWLNAAPQSDHGL